jgi:hypothetical protein
MTFWTVAVATATPLVALCAFSIFVLVEIIQLFTLAFIAHSRIIHPPNS